MSNETQEQAARPLTSPAGTGDYVVQEGDCLSSIALEHGFFWNALWDLPANKELKEKRKDPNALLPGDRVTIPAFRLHNEKCVTGQRHRFRRKGVPAQLIFRMEGADGKPRDHVRYALVIDAVLQPEGVTDANGAVTVRLMGNEKKGILRFDLSLPEPEEYELNLGYLDPLDSISGIQARLNNLGYDCGKVDGTFNDLTRTALEDFQDANHLTVTGKSDSATLDKLQELHGS